MCNEHPYKKINALQCNYIVSIITKCTGSITMHKCNPVLLYNY